MTARGCRVARWKGRRCGGSKGEQISIELMLICSKHAPTVVGTPEVTFAPVLPNACRDTHNTDSDYPINRVALDLQARLHSILRIGVFARAHLQPQFT